MYSEHFSIENIPFGIASSTEHPQKAVATRFEDTVIFLDELAKIDSNSVTNEIAKTFSSVNENYPLFRSSAYNVKETVNAFAALPKSEQRETRKWIQSHLAKGLSFFSPSAVSPISNCILHLPISIGDFTDFSCSRDHVLNAGEAVFKQRELPPGFEHFPIGYHGRSSTIVVSDTPIIRPIGQYRDAEGNVVFGPTKRLDYELEIGAVIGKPSKLGEPVKIDDADEHIFGLVLVNDWSARDIQGLEMIPLGPLNGKSFGTTVSPWVITLDALEPFKCSLPPRNADITLPAYLQDPDQKPTFDLKLNASLRSPNAAIWSNICESSFSSIYWTMRDLVAHQTVNGCSLNTGDLLATGTISGATKESHGCLLELIAKGGVEIKNATGEIEQRIFLEDGDTVSISASAGPGVGFGECVGTILPAK